jgi:hypothetical protein
VNAGEIIAVTIYAAAIAGGFTFLLRLPNAVDCEVYGDVPRIPDEMQTTARGSGGGGPSNGADRRCFARHIAHDGSVTSL